MIELRTLAYFVTACRSGSFAQAAEDLGVAVSTLSTTMKALERDVGVSLFRRIKNNLYPTEAARALMRGADPLLMAELFARRWAVAPARASLKLLTVEIGLSFTIGGLSKAVRQAIHQMGTERPDVFVDTIWADEKDAPHAGSIVEDWRDTESSRVEIALDYGSRQASKRVTTLLADQWVFACRMPSGTRSFPKAADLATGRLVVPRLSSTLTEQAERYFRQHKISGVRFLNDHPGDLPRIMDDYSEAALFVPGSLVSPRLGLTNIAAILPDEPLTTRIVARTTKPDTLTSLFVRKLRHALADTQPAFAERPVISLRQIRYFNLLQRLRRVSAAARGANISQPALSEQIHKLETSLGGTLFERRGDGMIPTVKGERFDRMSRLIETSFRRLSSGDDGAVPPQSRGIAIGILPSVNQHGFLVNRITEAILDVQERHPALKLVIREAPNGMLQDWVIRGLVGVAIVETILPQMPRLPLGSSERLAAITHTRHKMLPSGPVTLADLARLPLALPTNRFGLRQLLDASAEQHDIALRPYMEIDALPMAVAILGRLPICAVLPPSAVEREIAAGDLVVHPIIEPAISRRLFVIYSGERTLSESERDLVNSLRRKLSEPRHAN